MRMENKSKDGKEENLLNIKSTSPDISCNENSGGARAELSHDGISFFLGHISVHRRNCKVVAPHFLCQPIHLPISIQ